MYVYVKWSYIYSHNGDEATAKWRKYTSILHNLNSFNWIKVQLMQQWGKENTKTSS